MIKNNTKKCYKTQIISTLNTNFDMKIQKNRNISKIRNLMLGNMQVKTKNISYLLYSNIEQTFLNVLRMEDYFDSIYVKCTFNTVQFFPFNGKIDNNLPSEREEYLSQKIFYCMCVNKIDDR